MKNVFPAFLIALILCFVGISPTQSFTEESSRGALLPMPVTAAVLEAKISEAEANPDLKAGAKDKLVALNREALSNLKQADANSTRADVFEEATRTAPEQTQRVRERTDALKVVAKLIRHPQIDPLGVDRKHRASWHAATGGSAAVATVLIGHIGHDRYEGVASVLQRTGGEHATEGARQKLAGLVGLFVTAIHPCSVAACNPFANRAAEKSKGGTDDG